jgi:hypothetical protein
MHVVGWVGRLLMRSGQIDRAAEWLKKPVDSGYADAAIISWYAEVLYVLGRFADVRQLLRNHGQKLLGLGSGQTSMADSVALWSGSTKGALA